MRAVHRIFAGLAAFSAIIVLLITSIELAIYMDSRFYEKEYKKYRVLDDLDMEMKDVMSVTHEMMDYLHGKRDDLVVMTTVDGEEREFFNDREKQHSENEEYCRQSIDTEFGSVDFFKGKVENSFRKMVYGNYLRAYSGRSGLGIFIFKRF